MERESATGSRQAHLELRAENFDHGNLRFCLILNLAKFISHSLHAQVSRLPFPPYPILLPGVFMSCGPGHLSHVDAAMLPVVAAAAVARQIETLF